MSHARPNNMEPTPADFALENEPAPAGGTAKGVGSGTLFYLFFLMSIKAIGHEAHVINKANGWEVFSPDDWSHGDINVRFLLTHMALVHSEVSEATEAVRHRDRENFDEELADIIIRVASIAHGLGTDLNAVIAAKLARNKTRGLHHGGKTV